MKWLFADMASKFVLDVNDSGKNNENIERGRHKADYCSRITSPYQYKKSLIGLIESLKAILWN